MECVKLYLVWSNVTQKTPKKDHVKTYKKISLKEGWVKTEEPVYSVSE